jgi:RNA polymerase sigma-70 factor (ECF subfamily)
MPASDDHLLELIATRDPGAFAEFYDRYAARVYGLLTRILGNRTDAEDVLQEAFLQVWEQARRFDPARAAADVWVLLIARSRAVDRLRKRTAVTSVELPDAGRSDDPARGLEVVETAGRVRSALDHLPADQKEAIGLAFFGGLTHEQIAARLGLPLGTVKTRIRLGMGRLRDRLAGPNPVGADA